MIITTEQIMSWYPCDRYNEGIVSDLIGAGKTPIEIAELGIPAEDRLWVLLRQDIIPEIQLHSLACDFAQEVAHLNPDPRVQAAIDAKRKWIAGQISDKELAAAETAARAAGEAARAAAWSAAWSAAEAAVWAAARSAARAAAWAAAREAAWAAAMEAAMEAAKEKQLNIVKIYLKSLDVKES